MITQDLSPIQLRLWTSDVSKPTYRTKVIHKITISYDNRLTKVRLQKAKLKLDNLLLCCLVIVKHFDRSSMIRLFHVCVSLLILYV